MHQRISPKLRVNLGYLIAKRVATQLLTSHGHQDQTVTNPSLLRSGLGSYQPDPLWSVTWISQMRGSSVVLPRIPRDRLQLQRCLKSQVNSIIGYGSSLDETTRLLYLSQRCYLFMSSSSGYLGKIRVLRTGAELMTFRICLSDALLMKKWSLFGPKGQKLGLNLFCLGFWVIKLHSSDTCPVLLLGFKSSFFLMYEIILYSYENQFLSFAIFGIGFPTLGNPSQAV